MSYVLQSRVEFALHYFEKNQDAMDLADHDGELMVQSLLFLLKNLDMFRFL